MAITHGVFIKCHLANIIINQWDSNAEIWISDPDYQIANLDDCCRHPFSFGIGEEKIH